MDENTFALIDKLQMELKSGKEITIDSVIDQMVDRNPLTIGFVLHQVFDMLMSDAVHLAKSKIFHKTRIKNIMESWKNIGELPEDPKTKDIIEVELSNGSIYESCPFHSFNGVFDGWEHELNYYKERFWGKTVVRWRYKQVVE